MIMNKADQKARVARGRDQARRNPEPMLVAEPSDMPGWQLWQVGGLGGAAVAIPKLLPGTPTSIRRRYRQRIAANATGECLRCGSVAADDLKPDQLSHSRLEHDDDCPLLLVEAEAERWFDPRSMPLRRALRAQLP
jgi:hypothetical protein